MTAKNKSDLLNSLENIKNAKRIYRDRAANFVLNHPEVMPDLLSVLFNTEDALHIRAAWVLDLVGQSHISLMDAYVSDFVKNMSKIENESSLRPVCKVCYFISKRFFDTNGPTFILSQNEIDQIIENNFDWLINDHKVATQVFAMDTLYLWGLKQEWIHEELKLVLQNNSSSGTKGYQSHARKLLKIL